MTHAAHEVPALSHDAHPSLTADEQQVVEAYHKLYYAKRLWDTTTWLGAACLKSPHDVWIYQEILVETRPTLIIETGTAWGGSAHFLGCVLDALRARRNTRRPNSDD